MIFAMFRASSRGEFGTWRYRKPYQWRCQGWCGLSRKPCAPISALRGFRLWLDATQDRASEARTLSRRERALERSRSGSERPPYRTSW